MQKTISTLDFFDTELKAGLRKRLATFSKKYPDLCRLEKNCEQGGVTYILDKSRLSIRLQAPYSEERRQKASEFSKKYPDLCRLEKNCEQGGVTYILDKSRLSIRLQAPYSEERRQKASEYAKKHGLNSQQE